jgi:hypothetical protein
MSSPAAQAFRTNPPAGLPRRMDKVVLFGLSTAVVNPLSVRAQRSSRLSPFSKEELRDYSSGRGKKVVRSPRSRKSRVRRMLHGAMTAQMCARRPIAPISGAGNSRIFGQTSRRTGYDRRHSSLVGARRLHSELGAENCEDHRSTRRTRFPRRKAIFGRQDILPGLSALSLRCSTTATARVLTVTRFR